MSSQDNDQDNRVVAVVLISTILMVVGLALGVGISKARSGGGSASGSGAMVGAPAAPGAEGQVQAASGMAAVDEAAPVAQAAPMEVAVAAAPVGNADDASVVIENGVVKFYFASAKADLAPGALAALGDAIAAAKAGKRLVLSGFHDASGNAAMNAELARKRALSVRDALVGAGVAESSMELKKPEESTGSGNDAEARRVEVTIIE